NIGIYLIFTVGLHLAQKDSFYAIQKGQASRIFSLSREFDPRILSPRNTILNTGAVKMIKYDSRFNEAILALRKLLIASNFDLLVRELKLPLTYFQVPGFVFYGHSIDKTLARLGKKYELLVRLFCLDQTVLASEVYQHILSEPVVADLIE